MGLNDDIHSSLRSHSTVKMTTRYENIPPVATPPRSATPPPLGEKRRPERKAVVENSTRRVSGGAVADAIDPNVLSKALLREFEDAGRTRDVTPGGSPSRKRQRVYGDR